MKPTLDFVRRLSELDDWFTVTRVSIRVSEDLGSYVTDLEVDPILALEAAEDAGELGEIVRISGVAHSPDRSWTVAFRIDEDGAKVASNAPSDVLAEVGPKLKGIMA